MYIIFYKDSKKVIQILGKKPVAISSTLEIARCDNIPKYNQAQGDYLTVANLQEKTEPYIVKEYVEKEIEIDGEIQTVIEEIEVEKERKYFTCDLIVNESPNKAELIEKQKQAKYESLVEKYIRQKYSANDENKVVREYLVDTNNGEKKLQFLEYNAYVENCKLRAKKETV